MSLVTLERGSNTALNLDESNTVFPQEISHEDTVTYTYRELYRIATFRGEMNDSHITTTLLDGCNACMQSQEDVQLGIEGIWVSSLQASFAVAIDALTKLDNLDYQSDRHSYNSNISNAVCSVAKLWSGRHLISYNVDQLSKRIAEHIRMMQSVSPHHRFPSNVAIEQILRDH